MTEEWRIVKTCRPPPSSSARNTLHQRRKPVYGGSMRASPSSALMLLKYEPIKEQRSRRINRKEETVSAYKKIRRRHYWRTIHLKSSGNARGTAGRAISREQKRACSERWHLHAETRISIPMPPLRNSSSAKPQQLRLRLSRHLIAALLAYRTSTGAPAENKRTAEGRCIGPFLAAAPTDAVMLA